jgi:hypothetical protein
MPCPHCGGAYRKPIEPGYWECTTLVQRPQSEMSAWEVWDPWLASINREPCGRRYRDGVVGPIEPPRSERAQPLSQAVQEKRREAAERAERAAKVVRENLELNAREATQRAYEHLVSTGRQTESVATIRWVNESKGPGGGAVNWFAVERRMGQGWYLGQFDWTPRDDRAATSTRMVLTEDGRLLEGDKDYGPRIRPGRYLSFLRPKVIPVEKGEFDITRCGNDSLADLAAGLLEIAAGGSSISCRHG